METASLYIRLSREARESNLSLAGMLNDTRDLAARLGYEVMAEHVDDGISGAVRDRPAFRAWLDDGRTGRANALLTYHADRVTREGVNVAAMVLDVVEGKDPTTGKVLDAPVRLATVDGLDSRDESYRMRLVFAAEMARSERERIKARNIATRARLIAAGRHTGGPVPFGCQVVVRDGGKYLQRCDVEADLLGEAAGRLIRGDGMRTVTRWLNLAGHRTRRGTQWQRSSLRATLLSAATREHVLSLATYRALEVRLSPKDEDKARFAGGRPVAHLLAGGLALCASCGRKMTTSAGRYICSSTSGGFTCSRIMTIGADATDALLEQTFLEHYGDQRGLELRVIVLGGEDLDDAERAQETAQEALLASPGTQTLAAYEAARERLATAKAQPIRRERQTFLSEQTYAEMWAAGDVPERSRILSQALAYPVVIHPAKAAPRVEMVWRDQVNPEDI